MTNDANFIKYDTLKCECLKQLYRRLIKVTWFSWSCFSFDSVQFNNYISITKWVIFRDKQIVSWFSLSQFSSIKVLMLWNLSIIKLIQRISFKATLQKTIIQLNLVLIQ